MLRYLDIGYWLPGEVGGAADLLPAVTRGHVDSQDTRAHVPQRHGDLGGVGLLTGLSTLTCFIRVSLSTLARYLGCRHGKVHGVGHQVLYVVLFDVRKYLLTATKIPDAR